MLPQEPRPRKPPEEVPLPPRAAGADLPPDLPTANAIALPPTNAIALPQATPKADSLAGPILPKPISKIYVDVPKVVAVPLAPPPSTAPAPIKVIQESASAPVLPTTRNAKPWVPRPRSPREHQPVFFKVPQNTLKRSDVWSDFSRRGEGPGSTSPSRTAADISPVPGPVPSPTPRSPVGYTSAYASLMALSPTPTAPDRAEPSRAVNSPLLCGTFFVPVLSAPAFSHSLSMSFLPARPKTSDGIMHQNSRQARSRLPPSTAYSQLRASDSHASSCKCPETSRPKPSSAACVRPSTVTWMGQPRLSAMGLSTTEVLDRPPPSFGRQSRAASRLTTPSHATQRTARLQRRHTDAAWLSPRAASAATVSPDAVSSDVSSKPFKGHATSRQSKKQSLQRLVAQAGTSSSNNVDPLHRDFSLRLAPGEHITPQLLQEFLHTIPVGSAAPLTALMYASHVRPSSPILRALRP